MTVDVHVMALTATATKMTQNIIIKSIGMNNPKIISKIPDKTNITYYVNNISNFRTALQSKKSQLQEMRRQFPKLVIFCRTLKDCADIYEFFLSSLGKHFTDPIGAPNLSCFRLVDMYTSVTVPSVKEEIEKSMKDKDSTLRILVCTTAFGMGIDCQGVRSVIHWGPPKDIENYIQEVGRGGRDGRSTTAMLCFSNKSLTTTESSMKDYCLNTTKCRRKFLMAHFVDLYHSDISGTCACCDICKPICTCSNCMPK